MRAAWVWNTRRACSISRFGSATEDEGDRGTWKYQGISAWTGKTAKAIRQPRRALYKRTKKTVKDAKIYQPQQQTEHQNAAEKKILPSQTEHQNAAEKKIVPSVSSLNIPPKLVHQFYPQGFKSNSLFDRGKLSFLACTWFDIKNEP